MQIRIVAFRACLQQCISLFNRKFSSSPPWFPEFVRLFHRTFRQQLPIIDCSRKDMGQRREISVDGSVADGIAVGKFPFCKLIALFDYDVRREINKLESSDLFFPPVKLLPLQWC